MLQFIPMPDSSILAIRASGKLTHEDYQEFLPQLETKTNECGKASVFFELDNFSGWEIEAAKDDFNFALKHLSDFQRIAIVGDKAWEHWMAVMAKPFLALSDGELRYFDRENLQNAWDWLREREKIEALAEHINVYQKIVVAVDFSLPSKHAAKRAIKLAEQDNAELTLLHISQEAIVLPYYHDSMVAYPYYDLAVLDHDDQRQTAHAEEQMDAFVASLNSELTIKTEVLIGNPNSTILSFLEAQNTDLVVFGATKKKGLSKRLGSTPRYVLDHARCELLVVPLHDDARFNN